MLTLGFSPCPNDTFIFYALVNGVIEARGLDIKYRIEDVETLNRLALQRTLDVTKISCHAFIHLQDDYQFLSSGAALGRGCGPLIISKSPCTVMEMRDKSIAIPGELTTAYLLLRLFFDKIFHTKPAKIVTMPFYDIPVSVRDGKVDAGLIIHESRFTYEEYGLSRTVDLGEWWENETGFPIPLGGIVAKKTLGSKIERIQDLIRESVKYALSNRDEAMPFIKKYSQELSTHVINSHIDLYVNNFTIDIAEEGSASLNELLKRARLADSR
ncbi:MAG TPA: 1,4-dihydroxy-6-naphthoate synthase [Dissulfurispiraceae bacterium]|nr:1,4-dihydroxy-6-naphthoate synthase [Dissulfurispiraceae bacterium]